MNRLSGRDRSYIKGQKYTLLSRRENLTLDGRKALRKLLAANNRLNRAYLLKESFGAAGGAAHHGIAHVEFHLVGVTPRGEVLEPATPLALVKIMHVSPERVQRGGGVGG